MNIALINIGNELLNGQTLNSHHQWIAKKCTEKGWPIIHQQTIRDQAEEIVSSINQQLTAGHLVICTGGLGPTSDDITRQVVAESFGVGLEMCPEVESHIREFFRKRNRPMPESVLSQAEKIEGSHLFLNHHGTAPGIAIQHKQTGSWLIMLPGPPRELHPMFSEQTIPFIEQNIIHDVTYSCRVFRTVGLGESKVQELIEEPMSEFVSKGLDIGYCARTGEVDVRFAHSQENGNAIVEAASQQFQDLLSEFIIGDGDIDIEEVVVSTLNQKKYNVATAESCTGGYIGHRLTLVSGASNVYLGGGVTYSNLEKVRQLDVDPDVLENKGAVSPEVAIAMAEGVKKFTGADFGISTTGIAGPTGGTEEKPVGLVYMAVAGPHRTIVYSRINSFDRPTFKFVTSQQLLDMLRRELLDLPQL